MTTRPPIESAAEVILSDPIVLDSPFGPLPLQHVSALGKEGVVASQSLDAAEPLTLRFQSSCLFSESFHAGDCDCALQLHDSLHRISSRGGILIYLYDEGRGAGLLQKFNAIRIQQSESVDTASAFRSLGLEPEQRTFEAAVSILRHLIDPDRHIHFLTNNNRKVEALKAAGFASVVREPLVLDSNPRTRAYLEQKRDALGHII